MAVCERAQIAASSAVRTRDEDDARIKLHTFDGEIQPLQGIKGRLGLRLSNDPIFEAMSEAVSSLQRIRNGLGRCVFDPNAWDPQEVSNAQDAFLSAHARFIGLSRQVVGPSEQALARMRERRAGSRGSPAASQ